MFKSIDSKITRLVSLSVFAANREKQTLQGG